MSLPADETSSTSNVVEPISKVTFAPLNSEALIVSIKTVPPKPGEVGELLKRSESLDSKRRSKSLRSFSEKSSSKATMTDYKKEISVASQTSSEQPHLPSFKTEQNISTHTPCLKHAAENISIKAGDMPADKLSLCNNCSKSMLSYIFVVQDFLESLTKEICGSSDSKKCVQCLREEVRQQMITRSDEAALAGIRGEKKESSVRRKTRESEKHDITKSVRDSRPDKTNENVTNKTRKSNIYPTNANAQPSGENLQPPGGNLQPPGGNLQPPGGNLQPPGGNLQPHGDNIHQSGNNQPQNVPCRTQYSPGHNRDGNNNPNQPTSSPSTIPSVQNTSHYPVGQSRIHQPSTNVVPTCVSSQTQSSLPGEHQGDSFNSATSDSGYFNQPGSEHFHQHNKLFIKTMERQQPDFSEDMASDKHFQDSDGNVFVHPESVTSPFGEEHGRPFSSLTSAEREEYDSARNRAGFETLAETQERLVDSSGRIMTEAFVTMCRNNAEALGCLVLGTSILLTHTKRTLCVLVSDGVSMAFRESLSAIFHVVQTVRQLDSLGTTKLALLEQPELGISFDKLNVWRLKQFHKCVYLNPDTLVIQNCDELFDREEMSAVPDIGWPDCFNSGVFVYRPSDHTFWQLLEFSDKQGSYDGGDQGLLNSYFSSWNSDINKKLSFIYNLMANVSYTYTPAFKKFGKDVKIVQFHGTFKPWHVKFFNVTGLISPASNVHPTYVDFVNMWIKIFRGNALRQLSQEIQTYANSQELICAVELLRFFPLPTELEAEFFLTPPSVRLRLAEMKLRRTPRPIEEAQRRKSAEFPRRTKADVVEVTQVKESETPNPDTSIESNEEVLTPAIADESGNPVDDKSGDSQEKQAAAEDEINKLPGAEVGDYQGMKKWEQGKMDYQGKDSSDSILKRLEYLMSQPKQ